MKEWRIRHLKTLPKRLRNAWTVVVNRVVFWWQIRRAVNRFNRLMPQERLEVYISLLEQYPTLARDLRRALKMNDAPNVPESRILTPDRFRR